MCDTFVALPGTTADGSLLFAKNSDRDPNEAHEVILVPARDTTESSLQCTYIAIPQMKHTHAVLLWIWGAEMGANEHGVVIGNEAIFSKVPAGKEPGLIGMDYLRLALERAVTAEEAMHVIIELLAEYGQSGNCGYEHPLYYHNSYLIADSHSAWVLETVGKEWAAKSVKDVASISNQISIHSDFDRSSARLISDAIARGWCKSADSFDFHTAYSDFLYTTFGDGKRREGETTSCLQAQAGSIREETMFALLRHHRGDGIHGSHLTGADVCMHASFGPIRGSQTTGSMVARITPEGATFWITGTSAPCTSIFKPVWMDAGLPAIGTAAGKYYDQDNLWWHHETLHRLILQDYENRHPIILQARNRLEEQFLAKARSLSAADAGARLAFSQQCFDQARGVTDGWKNVISAMPASKKGSPLYSSAWRQWNRKAKMPVI